MAMIAKNNPFNIRFSKSSHWLGQTGQRKGFVEFSELKFGVRAAATLIKNYYQLYGLKTVSQIIYRYAPPFENDTASYIDFVSNRTHLPENYVIRSDDQFVRVLEAISVYEGNPVNSYDIFLLLSYTNFNYPNYEAEDD